jgi:hypothetical protein
MTAEMLQESRVRFLEPEDYELCERCPVAISDLR